MKHECCGEVLTLLTQGSAAWHAALNGRVTSEDRLAINKPDAWRCRKCLRSYVQRKKQPRYAPAKKLGKKRGAYKQKGL